MKKTYDFSGGTRGAVVPAAARGQTPITLPLDDKVIDWFRRQVNDAGGRDYLVLINAVPREHIQHRSGHLVEETLRKVIREELRAGDFAALDLEHIAGEIEDVGNCPWAVEQVLAAEFYPV